MTRRTILAVLAMTVAALSPQWARADANDVLKHISADSHGVGVVGNWQGFGAKVGRVAQALGLGEMVPPDGLTMPLGQETGLNLQQLDAQGSLGMVLHRMSAREGADEMADRKDAEAVVLLPVKDYNAFLADNNKGEKDGMATIKTAKGDVLLVKQVGRYACLSEQAGALAAVGGEGKSLFDALGAQQKKLASEVDVFIHVNLQAMLPTVEQALANEIGGGEETMAVVGMLKKMAADGESLDLGGLITDDGFELRGMLLAKDDSKLATAMNKVAANKDPLVKGVPVNNYILAWGGKGLSQLNAAFSENAGDVMAQIFAMVGQAEGGKKLMTHANALAGLTVRSSGSVTATAGQGGQASLPVTIYQVAEVTDAAAAQQAMKNYLKDFAALTNTAVKQAMPAPAGANGQQQQVPDALIFAEGAETIGEVKVDTLTLNLAAFGQDAQAGAMFVPMVLGEATVTVRVGMKGNHIVTTVGGGQQAFTNALAALANNTTLANDAGLAKALTHLTPERNVEMFFMGNRLAQLSSGVAAMFVGQPLPAFPKVEVPVVMGVKVDGRLAEGRVFVPMSLILAGQKWVNDIQKMMAQPQGEPAPMQGGDDF